MNFLNETGITPAEIPVIRHTDDLPAAAAALATSNCAYVVPRQIDSPFGPVSDPARKMNALVYVLDSIRPRWGAQPGEPRRVTALSDRGMHGNAYDPHYQQNSDYLHYHQTPLGAVTVTFARPGEQYMANMREGNRRLTDLLRVGKTDRRYADPESFQRATIQPGEAVVFRLNEGLSGEPLLHDFRTVTDGRIADITAITRSERYYPETFDPFALIESALSALRHFR